MRRLRAYICAATWLVDNTDRFRSRNYLKISSLPLRYIDGRRRLSGDFFDVTFGIWKTSRVGCTIGPHREIRIWYHCNLTRQMLIFSNYKLKYIRYWHVKNENHIEEHPCAIFASTRASEKDICFPIGVYEVQAIQDIISWAKKNTGTLSRVTRAICVAFV